MSKLYYFRDFSKRKFCSTLGKTVTYDCSKLSLVERLVVSAYITLLLKDIDVSSSGADKADTLAKVIYDYDGYQTPKNFDDFDEAVTNIFMNHIELLHHIKDNIDSVKSGVKDGAIYVVKIETEEIFLVKSTGKSICPIAWKAAMLASINSKYKKIEQLNKLHYINWSIDKVDCADKKRIKNMKQNKANTLERITNWVNAVKDHRNLDSVGGFSGDYFLVDAKKAQ